MPTYRTSAAAIVLGLVYAGLPPFCGACAVATPATAPATRPAEHTNRLAGAKSPYLLQHAHNPVDWYPWGDEAFAKAKRENKPIFLSIGYSTCHWCHVMERESFENPEVAKLLNDGFVAIKVDREERPDLDRVYMTFVQATTGSGGWPMTVFLTPEGKPFFGATYFPAETREGSIGLKTLLPRVVDSWKTDRDKIIASAEDVTKALKAFTTRDRGPAGGAITADATLASYLKAFDKQRGGFSGAPKFPEPVALDFLFHQFSRAGNAEARDLVLQTLKSMARGGIHDHLGGGFHRYSTDADWFLPHFEKMLYDQAQLAGLYVDAFRITHDPTFARTARDVLDYVLRDLTGPDGQFYSAEDADSAPDAEKPSKKREGAFYVWSAAELDQTLGVETSAIFKAHYGVKPDGNVERDPRREFPGCNVLFADKTIEETAKATGLTPAAVDKLLTDARATLLARRSGRPRPHRDDKALACWNGLAISAFAKAGAALDEPQYSQAALRAATFLQEKLYDPQTHSLYRHYREGRAEVPGFLDDYTQSISAMIDLYETTMDIQWFKLALDLQSRQDELFWDKEDGGYFQTAGTDASVLLRMKDDQEGVEPAGNSAAVVNLARLSQMTDDKALGEKADKTLKAYAGRIKESPTSLPLMVVGAGWRGVKPKQIVIAGDPASPEVKAMLREVQSRYLPEKMLLFAEGGEGQAFLAGRLDFLKDIKPIGGKATAFVCENYTCKEPVTDAAALGKQLDLVGATPASPGGH